VKKSRLAVLVTVAAVVLPLAVMPASAQQTKKPLKVEAKLMTVTPSGVWPTGEHSTLYSVKISFPYQAPIKAEEYRHATKFIATCTPSYKGETPEGAPDAPITATWNLGVTGVGISSGNYTGTSPDGGVDFSSTGGGPATRTIVLTMPPYTSPSTQVANRQFPPLKCKVDVQNGKATVTGKAAKLPTSPAASCGSLGDEPPDGILNDELKAPAEGTSTLFLHVLVDIGAAQFPFCTTGSSYKPRFLVDQETVFTGKTKAKPKALTAQVQNLQLKSFVNTQIPLTISGSTQVYYFDPAVLQVVPGPAGCVPQKAKSPFSNMCEVDIEPGTGRGRITIVSTSESIVKPGKPIVSPKVTVNFSYAAANDLNTWSNLSRGETSITFGKATTAITVSGVTVNVVVTNGVDAKIGGASIRASDPNRTHPILTFTGESGLYKP
jgi:hypothetical protein